MSKVREALQSALIEKLSPVIGLPLDGEVITKLQQLQSEFYNEVRDELDDLLNGGARSLIKLDNKDGDQND